MEILRIVFIVWCVCWINWRDRQTGRHRKWVGRWAWEPESTGNEGREGERTGKERWKGRKGNRKGRNVKREEEKKRGRKKEEEKEKGEGRAVCLWAWLAPPASVWDTWQQEAAFCLRPPLIQCSWPLLQCGPVNEDPLLIPCLVLPMGPVPLPQGLSHVVLWSTYTRTPVSSSRCWDLGGWGPHLRHHIISYNA